MADEAFVHHLEETYPGEIKSYSFPDGVDVGESAEVTPTYTTDEGEGHQQLVPFNPTLEELLPGAITDELHPLLDKTGRRKREEDENESNPIVIVDYRGKRYRVDFRKEGEEMMMLPRALKKVVALDDIREFVDAQERQEAEVQLRRERLARANPRQFNQYAQGVQRHSTVQRLREKLRQLNPLKHKGIHDRG